MVGTQFDSLWPWLRSEPQEDPLAFRVGGDAADPIIASTSFGLSNWRPPDSLQRSPWLGADPIPAGTTVGLSNWQPPDSVQQPMSSNAAHGLSNWQPPHSLEKPSWVGFRMKPNGAIDEARTGNVTSFDAGPPALAENPFFDMEQRPKTQPWWSQSLREAEEHGGASEAHWPWLRAEAGHESPAADVNADAATREAGPPEFNPLSFVAPPSRQATLENDASAVSAPLRAEMTSPDDVHPTVAGVMAATANAATAGGVPGSQAVGEAISKVAGLAGRVAPAAAGAASAAAAALPFLFIPTNTQSEIIDLEDGVRARVSPGQRTVEIERRVGTGLLGTGVGARWERLPVDAEVRVGRDGAATLVIDQGQLRQALTPREDQGAAISEMAQWPRKRKDGASQSPADIGRNSREVSGPKNDGSPDPKNGKGPDPNNGNKPSIWDHILASAAEIVGSGKQTKSVDEERIDACRKVMKAAGQASPDGQYRGPNGRDAKIGVRHGPDVRGPAAGLDHYPEQQHLRDGVRGEHELVNRIRQFNPNEKIIHFGAAAGTQGPDIMSISEKGEVAFWDSKWRNHEQSTPPSRRAHRSDKSMDKLQEAEKLIKKAVEDGDLSQDVAAKAMANLRSRNFLLCTVGMGQAHQGVVEIVKDGRRTGPL